MGAQPPNSQEKLDVDESSLEHYRLQDIFQARDRAAEVRQKARMERRRGRSGQAETAYRAAIEGYVMAAQETLTEGIGPSLWKQQHFGTTVIRPPGQPSDGYDGNWEIPGEGAQSRKVASRPQPVEIDIIGFKSLFKTDDPLTATFEFLVTDELTGTNSVPMTQKAQIDWHILDSMFLALNNHLSDVGLSLEIAENNEWEI